MNTLIINSVNVHKDFNKNKRTHDIAIVHLKTKITHKQKKELGIEYAKIFNRFVHNNLKSLAIGWGVQFDGGGASEKLLVTDIIASDYKDCESFNKKHDGNNESTICSRKISGKGICSGDSGGPLIFDEEKKGSNELKNAIVGINAHGMIDGGKRSKCQDFSALNYYTSTFYFLKWISDTSRIPIKELEYYPKDKKTNPKIVTEIPNIHEQKLNATEEKAKTPEKETKTKKIDEIIIKTITEKIIQTITQTITQTMTQTRTERKQGQQRKLKLLKQMIKP
ncbi:Brachyurin [Smittium culicis]|uniref:Brachyurin n=1 Tax=Smittium culicis TaxID=133412 RepID=A0A1R1XR19_9FUNG|nr:Brachyurin [Smittium culicis]